MQNARLPTGKPRCAVYIDGYNWYHAIFKNMPQWKWLNIQKMFELIRSREDVIAVKIFSALVEHDPEACYRQKIYFKALESLPKVTVKLGLFKPREVTCGADCKRKYSIQEEKKTDVNMAVAMLADVMGDACPDRLCVVTGDSDIEPAVEWISRNKHTVSITVYIPALAPEQSERRLDSFKTRRMRGVTVEFLPTEYMAGCQLNNLVTVRPGDFAYRPTSWK